MGDCVNQMGNKSENERKLSICRVQVVGFNTFPNFTEGKERDKETGEKEGDKNVTSTDPQAPQNSGAPIFDTIIHTASCILWDQSQPEG